MKSAIEKTKSVLVALSGGVDSSVSAAILKEKGHDCTGVFMELWPDKNTNDSLARAQKTCEQLGLPFGVVDFKKVFKEKIVDLFVADYRTGLTPNPCVACNRIIKFGSLFDYMRTQGFDFLASGHYARRALIDGIYHLVEAKDLTKDQSYFLYSLNQEKLERIIFPLGELTKEKIRRMASRLNLPAASVKDSQEICFIGGGDYREFLKERLKTKIVPGGVVDKKGRVIGQHKGLPLYTIGQRHGFNLNSKLIPPFYVLAKDSKKNRLVVGFGQETEQERFSVKKLTWINKEPARQGKLLVRIRYQGKLLPCLFKKVGNDLWQVKLKEPQRGIAPGQSAVFYFPFAWKGQKANEVLGGGQIV